MNHLKLLTLRRYLTNKITGLTVKNPIPAKTTGILMQLFAVNPYL
jgi:hypothetical protein